MSKTIKKIEQDIALEAIPPPLLKFSLPFSHRLTCLLHLWSFKILASIVFFFHQFIHPPPPHLRPTLIKTYSCRKGLPVRIFYPPNYKSGDLLPLYINIHGGGFAICDAQWDDEFCVDWAKRTGMLIVSLNYRKIPLYPFPTAVHDIGAVANAILKDDALPIEHSKVVIGGFSAGGNLALCASQLPDLKGNIEAALTFYPIVDWSHPPEHKLAVRPYTNGPKDSLASSAASFDWGYVSVGQNRREPLLSPCYADKVDLPPWIYIIGAQWDMLRLEAQDMIHKLAGLEGKEDQEEDFEEGGYKWTLARSLRHGFTHHFGKSAEERRMREARCEIMYQEAWEWLKRGALA